VLDPKLVITQKAVDIENEVENEEN